MKRMLLRVLSISVLAASLAAPARAELESFSRLATEKLAPPAAGGAVLTADDAPRLWIAQRTIVREWGPSEDSVYVVVDLPGYKSEGWAMAMSGALPGTGQLYSGEGSGWWFLLGEIAGWTGRQLYLNKADRYAGDAARFVGDPHDSSSAWSFARYQAATGGATDYLETLWNVDRDAYYAALRRDSQYLRGFAGAQPSKTLAAFVDLRQNRDRSLVRSRYVETALILNHLYAAWDALRAARFHNLPLRSREGTRLQLGQRWGEDGAEWRAALVRSF